MKEFWNFIQMVFMAVGGWLGWFMGGCDGLLYALIAFVVIDYLTGVMCAFADHTLSIDGGGVAAIPEMVVNLADTAGAGLAALTLVGLEGGGCWLGRENLLLR